MEVVEFSPSATVQYINITVILDDALESTELFTLHITPVVGTAVSNFRGSITVNITDGTAGV